jgi:UDP-galactopyranose mutase
MRTDVTIVGAGFFGVSAARVLAEKYGRKILVIEKRNHIGGNSHDAVNRNGIAVHTYGPHIFHTGSDAVFRFLSRFTAWLPYEHKVLAQVDGMRIPLPFNLNSVDRVFPRAMAGRITDRLTGEFGYGARVPILELKGSRDPDVRFLAQYVYDKVFLKYTEKQWGCAPEDLDGEVTARVPVLVSREDRYFQDFYQGIPADGYTRLFERILDHPNIRLMLKTDFFDVKDEISQNALIFTGPIDEYFGCRFGRLPYRAVDFRFEDCGAAIYQEAATVNYPSGCDFTRITDFKHFDRSKTGPTTILKEYSKECSESDIPSYPIPMGKNRDLYARYAELGETAGAVLFGGRLGGYRYLNMDQSVLEGMALAEHAAKTLVFSFS